jgi:hypothetical protein
MFLGIEEGNGRKYIYRISWDWRLGNISDCAINQHIGHGIIYSIPVEGEAQASYACTISSFKLYLEIIRLYEAIGAKGRVIGISEGNVKGVTVVVFTAGAAFNVAILGAGKALARRARRTLRTLFTSTAPHYPRGKQDDSMQSD